MTLHDPACSIPLTNWQWPLDLGRYDRRPDLTPEEDRTLSHLARLKKGTQVFEQGTSLIPLAPDAPLFRLLQPIYDVWEVTGVRGQECTDALAVLLREMRRRHQTYWAWTDEDWLAILGTNPMTFRQHSGKKHNCRRVLLLVSYLLCGFTDLRLLSPCRLPALATCVFGAEATQAALGRVCEELRAWGYSEQRAQSEFPNVLALLLLANRSPRIEDLSVAVLEQVRDAPISTHYKDDLLPVSRILAQLGCIDYALDRVMHSKYRQLYSDKLEGVPQVWAQWATRWRDTSTLAPRSRQALYRLLIKMGRWIAATSPAMASPMDWTRETTLTCVAAIDRMTVGQWVQTMSGHHARNVGKPLQAATKEKHLTAMRTFFRDGQEWGWFPRRFNPTQCFAAPRSIRALIGPDPRIIADDVWAKLLWAGLNLTEADIPATGFAAKGEKVTRTSFYPVEMVRAMVIVWLFAGLRSDEFCRLRVGCVRWQREEIPIMETGEVLPKDAVCWLDVPVHKTGTAFSKAVDRVVGEAILQWERVRPSHQPATIDRKTGDVVHLLFSYRGHHVGQTYINNALIPILCRKAGIPKTDARGSITSHRARSTIASQLFNAKEPLSLFDLQEWLGHRRLSSTQYYAKKSPTQVAKAYEKAGYFGRNLRTIAVLLDQDGIKSGAAASGQPWKFYDLGHGYCTYEFFDQCPHRMACAKCAFYYPKASAQAQALEGKANLQRMLQEIPLTEEERAAVEDGMGALEQLCQRLADVPTPAGLTPNQLGSTDRHRLTFISVEEILQKGQKQ